MKTIQEVINEYLDQIQGSKSSNTIRAYRDGLELFVEYLGDTTGNINELTPQKFIDYPFWLIKRYENKRSVLLREASVKSFREWLHHRRYIQWNTQDETDYVYANENAFSKRGYFKPKRVPRSDIMRAIEFVSQMDTFYPIERARNVAIINLLADSAVRVSEAAALKVSDINMKENKFYVRKAKEDKSYYAPISGKTSELIQAYWTERGWADADDPAFARHDKKNGDKHTSVSAQGIQFMMRELRKQAGITTKLTAHKFRHDTATEVTKKYGVQLASKWLHHSSIGTTQVYVDLDEDEVMDAAKEMFGD